MIFGMRSVPHTEDDTEVHYHRERYGRHCILLPLVTLLTKVLVICVVGKKVSTVLIFHAIWIQWFSELCWAQVESLHNPPPFPCLWPSLLSDAECFKTEAFLFQNTPQKSRAKITTSHEDFRSHMKKSRVAHMASACTTQNWSLGSWSHAPIAIRAPSCRSNVATVSLVPRTPGKAEGTSTVAGSSLSYPTWVTYCAPESAWHRIPWWQLAAAQAVPLLVVSKEPNISTCLNVALELIKTWFHFLWKILVFQKEKNEKFSISVLEMLLWFWIGVVIWVYYVPRYNSLLEVVLHGRWSPVGLPSQ